MSFMKDHRCPLDLGTPVDDDTLTTREPDHQLAATHPRRNLDVPEVGLCEDSLEMPMIHGRRGHDHPVTLHPQHPAPSRPERWKGSQDRRTSAESDERRRRNAVPCQIGIERRGNPQENLSVMAGIHRLMIATLDAVGGRGQMMSRCPECGEVGVRVVYVNPKHARTRSDALRRVDEHVARIAAMTGSELDEYVAGIEAETALRDPQDLLDEAAARKQWKYRRN